MQQLQSDRWRITWRDVKKTAITALLTSAAATLQQSFNLNPNVKEPFFQLPNLHTLAVVGGVAASTFAAEMIRRWSTDRVKSAQITLQNATDKQILKEQTSKITQ